jgi:hypothetical protein
MTKDNESTKRLRERGRAWLEARKQWLAASESKAKDMDRREYATPEAIRQHILELRRAAVSKSNREGGA